MHIFRKRLKITADLETPFSSGGWRLRPTPDPHVVTLTYVYTVDLSNVCF